MFIVVYVFIILVFLIGNFFLIVFCMRKKELWLFYIMNMVIFDLFVVIFLFLCFIIDEIIGFGVFLVYGFGGIFLCKMCSFLSDIFLFVFIFILVMIVVECFLVVVNFFLYIRIMSFCKRCCFVIVLIWILVVVIYLLYFYIFRLMRVVIG